MTPPRQTAAPSIGRRAALRQLGAVAVGLGAAGCSRGAILRAMYPEAVTLSDGAEDAFLAAFVLTVVPGFARPEPIVTLLRDPALPFADLAPVLAADLARRAARVAGTNAFPTLSAGERTAVVADGIEGGGIPARIYGGAVLFVQAAVYGGMGSADGSCAITGFEGPFRFRGYEVQTYPHPEHFLPPPATPDGNPW